MEKNLFEVSYKLSLVTPVIQLYVLYRLWGEDSLSTFGGNWRELFLKTPHLHFNGQTNVMSRMYGCTCMTCMSTGVYISKSTYVRQGEKSLDGYYKPYHTVVYYRYLRFFADGESSTLSTLAGRV